MAATVTDRAYANLLTHLQQPRTFIPFETVRAAIPHYLAHLPLPHPTQLTGFVLSSPLWWPLSINYISSLIDAYRTAVHVKQGILEKETGGWFSPSAQSLLAQWINAIIKGTSSGSPQLIMAIMGGVMLGLNDMPTGIVLSRSKEQTERQLIIACAETMDAISADKNEWMSEFESKKLREMGDSDETLFLYLAYTSLLPIPDEKFLALETKALTRYAERGVDQAFFSGKFLTGLSESVTEDSSSIFSIPANSPTANSLKMLINTSLYQNAGPLAKLLSRCIHATTDQYPKDSFGVFRYISSQMEAVTANVQSDWNSSPLSSVTKEEQIEYHSRAISTEIWKILKTLLFTHVMVSQAILTSIRYLRPSLYSNDLELRPSSISRSILRSLYNLSFVISQFGGIVSTGAGFKELKRAFYMAIDIMEADLEPQATNEFAVDLIKRMSDSILSSNHPSRQAQSAFTLAVLEQLVSVLTDSVIESSVIPFCAPYLNNPAHRETYESAHSVMLSIFAARAQRKDDKGDQSAALAETLVPFYTDSLIKNSAGGRLNISQLRLAYSNLVKSASSSRDDALAWLCIEALISHMQTAHPSSRMPLYLTMVSLIPCVRGRLLPQLLVEIQKAVNDVDDNGKKELEKAIAHEIMHNVREKEKEAVLSWYSTVMRSEDTQPEVEG